VSVVVRLGRGRVLHRRLQDAMGDHLGSASLATNAAGTEVSDERYLPYGATRSGGVATDYQFAGQKNDGSTGLYYYGARYYDQVVGRFISADTIVPGAGNPQALNRYAYTMNNPVRYTDPSGHCFWDACVAEISLGGMVLTVGTVEIAAITAAALSTLYLATQQQSQQSAIAGALAGSRSDPVQDSINGIWWAQSDAGNPASLPGPIQGGDSLGPGTKRVMVALVAIGGFVVAHNGWKTPEDAAEKSLGPTPKPLPTRRPTPSPTTRTPPGTPAPPSLRAPTRPQMLDPNFVEPPSPSSRASLPDRPPGRGQIE
jgi:RHS repeat-associated protein